MIIFPLSKTPTWHWPMITGSAYSAIASPVVNHMTDMTHECHVLLWQCDIFFVQSRCTKTHFIIVTFFEHVHDRRLQHFYGTFNPPMTLVRLCLGRWWPAAKLRPLLLRPSVLRASIFSPSLTSGGVLHNRWRDYGGDLIVSYSITSLWVEYFQFFQENGSYSWQTRKS